MGSRPDRPGRPPVGRCDFRLPKREATIAIEREHVSSPTELTGVLVGFDVVDREGQKVGPVTMVNLARTCVIVNTGRSRFGRKLDRPVHVSSVTRIDLDTFTINVAATKEQIAQAPELNELDDASEADVGGYYDGLTRP